MKLTSAVLIMIASFAVAHGQANEVIENPTVEDYLGLMTRQEAEMQVWADQRLREGAQLARFHFGWILEQGAIDITWAGADAAWNELDPTEVYLASGLRISHRLQDGDDDGSPPGRDSTCSKTQLNGTDVCLGNCPAMSASVTCPDGRVITHDVVARCATNESGCGCRWQTLLWIDLDTCEGKVRDGGATGGGEMGNLSPRPGPTEETESELSPRPKIQRP